MKNDIKNIFKGHFESHDTDLDTTALWDAIEKKRQPKKRRFLFLILPIGLVTISLLSLFISKSTQKDTFLESSSVSTTTVSSITKEPKTTTNKNDDYSSENKPKNNIEKTSTAQSVQEIKNTTPTTPLNSTVTTQQPIVHNNSKLQLADQIINHNSASTFNSANNITTTENPSTPSSPIAEQKHTPALAPTKDNYQQITTLQPLPANAHIFCLLYTSPSPRDRG